MLLKQVLKFFVFIILPQFICLTQLHFRLIKTYFHFHKGIMEYIHPFSACTVDTLRILHSGP